MAPRPTLPFAQLKLSPSQPRRGKRRGGSQCAERGCLGFGGGFICCAGRNVGGKGEAKWTFAGWAEKKRGNGVVVREVAQLC
uniref:Uncharacterized protein n=1 Tax=Oryza punctata TaxID=4537 RepID=A0A0E0M7Q0_ORYPU